MNQDYMRRLVGILIILGSVAFMFLAWYGYFVLKRLDLHKVILATIFLGSCAVGGFVYLGVSHYQERRWWIPDQDRLAKSQDLLIAGMGLLFAVSALWIALDNNLHMLLRATLAIGCFYFLWHAVMKFQRAFKKLDKETNH